MDVLNPTKNLVEEELYMGDCEFVGGPDHLVQVVTSAVSNEVNVHS
jgi:hypothetical protein